MQAPYKGTLEWVGTPKEGTSRNGTQWKMVDFTLKYLDHQMQEKFIVFSLSGVERVNKILSTPIGSEIIVSWEPSGRVWENGGETKWFPVITAIGIRTQETQTHPVQPVQKTKGNDDDLPWDF